MRGLRDCWLQRDPGPRCVVRLRWFLPLGLALLAAPAFGQGSVSELIVFRAGDSVRAEVRAHHLLDRRTTETIQSGFSGVCLYLLRLADRSGRVVAERSVERSLSYDAWKGCYLLQSENDVLALSTLAAADSAISLLTNCELCPTSRLDLAVEYQLSLRIAVQPLASDRAAGLSGHDRALTADGDGAALNLNTLFGRTDRAPSASGPVLGRSSLFFRAADLKEAP